MQPTIYIIISVWDPIYGYDNLQIRVFSAATQLYFAV
jgi:hypothetical protein